MKASEIQAGQHFKFPGRKFRKVYTAHKTMVVYHPPDDCNKILFVTDNCRQLVVALDAEVELVEGGAAHG
jgi:hypothetical protein